MFDLKANATRKPEMISFKMPERPSFEESSLFYQEKNEGGDKGDIFDQFQQKFQDMIKSLEDEEVKRQELEKKNQQLRQRIFSPVTFSQALQSTQNTTMEP
mmetsp:Transcript_39172/g.37544  ORF Transcript_39172/g.37544 Transcript_39172/m.37544 type:complete len:101 (+) Transcript_39172:212-514(+)